MTQGVLNLKKDLIWLDADFHTKEELFKAVGKKFGELGYVKNSFSDALAEREKNFPTGVPEEGLGSAVPHATSEHVIKPSMAIAVLKRPVRFNLMGSPDESADVDLIFMLAAGTPRDHMVALGKVISILMSSEKTDRIRNLADPAEAADFLETEINDKKVENCI